jgi:hypothetical protein
MRTILLSLSLAFVGCHSPTFFPTVPYGPVVVAPAANVAPAVRRLHDSVAAAVGLPPLADVPVPEGYREIRLSSGHGMIAGAEYPMLRLVEGPGGVTGELLLFRVRLDAPVASQRWAVRRLGEAPAEGWSVWLRQLDSLGVARPPAEGPRRYITDSGHLIVEVRHGGEYLTYDVNAPMYRQDAEGQRAAAMVRVLDAAAKVIPR